MTKETHRDSKSEYEKQVKPLAGEVAPEEALSKAIQFASMEKARMGAGVTKVGRSK